MKQFNMMIYLWTIVSGFLILQCEKDIETCDRNEKTVKSGREILWGQPYSSTSIWNMPIHKNAEYYFIGDNFYYHNKYVDVIFVS